MAGLFYRFWIIALNLRLQSASRSIGVTLYIAFHSLMCSKSAEMPGPFTQRILRNKRKFTRP